MRYKTLITGKLHDGAIKAFEAHPKLDVIYRPDIKRDDLLPLMKDIQVIVSRSETDVDKALIEAAPELKIIARAAVGVGNIHLEYATERGILVINTPGKNTNAAAELTFGILLAMARKIPEAQNKIKSGGWDRHHFTGSELRGKSIGIVGLGNVGHRVAQFARGFDMEVWAYDPYIAPEVFERHRAKRATSLVDLAHKVDILTLHVPLNKETTSMVTREVLKALKPGSMLINAARGGLVSEDLLLEFLESGQLAGAGIDTFAQEPVPFPALAKHPKVWCTPHIGASTHEAQLAIGETIVQQVFKAIEGTAVDYPVNLPEVAILDQPIQKAYTVLAEKLGSLVGQLLNFNPTEVKLRYRGDISQLNNTILKLAWMKGFASEVVDAYVSFVNAQQHCEALGLKVTEEVDPSFRSYKSALKIELSGQNGQELSVGGFVFDDRYLRVSLINNFPFEIAPEGHYLAIENEDQPGVIGELGLNLGMHKINISNFVLSRQDRGGKAMAMVAVDQEVSPELIAKLMKLKHILSVKALRL